MDHTLHTVWQQLTLWWQAAFGPVAGTLGSATAQLDMTSLLALGLQCLPSAGNFVTARFADAQAAQSAHARLLASGIAVSTLEPYDMADSLRISVGLPEHNRAVLDALA